MTKKIIHTVEGDGRKEFLIPTTTPDGIDLIGVKSGNAYTRGMVVLTSIKMTPDVLSEKATLLGVKPEPQLYEQYIKQIPDFKISKFVLLNKNTKGLELTYA